MERTKLLGIDPSFSTMGASIYNPKDKTLQTGSGDFFQCLAWINRTCKMPEIIAFVEDPSLDKAVFNMWGLMRKEIFAYVKYEVWRRTSGGSMKGMPEKVTIESVQSVFNIALNYAQKVGENKAAAKTIIKMLKERRVPVVRIAPSHRERADKPPKIGKIQLGAKFLTMPTKTTQEQFFELTGFSGHTNEHARDSATMIHGRSIKWAEMMLQMNERMTKKGGMTKKERDKLLSRQI